MTATEFDDVVERERARSNQRRQRTINQLVETLNDMARRGIKVFTVANVGRETEQRGFLKAQSIRNANGKGFREIINAFAALHGLATTHTPARKVTPLEEAIRAIPDLDIRVRLLSLIDENKALRDQLQRLENGFKRLQASDAKIVEVPPEALPAPDIEIIGPRARARVNRGPLERFISEEWVDQNAWTVNGSGTIMEGRHMITPPGFVPAMKDALKALGE